MSTGTEVEMDCAPEPCLDEQTSEDTPMCEPEPANYGPEDENQCEAESTHYAEPLCEPEAPWSPNLMPQGAGIGRAYVPPRYEALAPIFVQLREVLAGIDPAIKVKLNVEITDER